ncbi:hypothetical protein AWB78_05322 [Caballeronia calidae]|uniref:NrS-1 polymerase-like helicase domain-containing protein n=1 Tax=Caballeronia calidae TaxID=1777139 RepID=A0A158DKV5_9BURK|nr:primase-helicase family protein [Caballeronia calidae]SAK95258.1 hypothetical protein AWB78_05322 [Caballeronia calidae]
MNHPEKSSEINGVAQDDQDNEELFEEFEEGKDYGTPWPEVVSSDAPATEVTRGRSRGPKPDAGSGASEVVIDDPYKGMSFAERNAARKKEALETALRQGTARILQAKEGDKRAPEGFVIAPNGDDIVPNGTILNGVVYHLPDGGGTLLVDSWPSIKKSHGIGMLSQGIPPREKAFVTAGGWKSIGHGFEYTSDMAAEDHKLDMNALANAFTRVELQSRFEALMDLRRNQRPFTSHEQALFDKICEAAKTRGEIEANRDKGKGAMNGYARSMKMETLPEDWVWMPNKSQSGVAYFHLESPFTSYQAKVMNARIPMNLWEDQLDSNGKPIYGRNGAPVKVQPSDSHLSRPDYEIQKLTMDPSKGRIYRDSTGERCLNHWRDIKFPARPEEKYFKVVKIVKNWLEFIYPGRAEWMLDYWAHALQRMTEKPSVAMVLGGGQGIGKDTLLTIANWTFLQQGKVATIMTSQLAERFNEFLFFPIVIVNELDIKRSDKSFNKLKRDYKTYTGGLPSQLTVDPKGLPLQHVANIHRFYTTTNYEDEFPRDPDDRRYMILRSHAVLAEVQAKRREWFADCQTEDGERFDIMKWLAEGYGDAFTCFLLDRDISAFDPYNLPADLMKDYDELKKGIDIEPVIGAALNEIALTFGRWTHDDSCMIEWPSDEAEVSMEHWPDFVTSQQLLFSRASFDPELEGEKVQRTKQQRGHLDVLMRTAGYIPVTRPEGKIQWVGAKPRKSDVGVTRVQSSTLYIRRSKIDHGETVAKRQARAKDFIETLTEFLRTTEGKEAVWTQLRWDDQM